MILSQGTNLYRYNLGTDIPDEWSVEYHSPEYFSKQHGHKNQIGAFFFYVNEITASNVLSAAIKRATCRGQIYRNNIITKCKTTADLEILDITGCERPIQILNKLYDEGIDVLTSEFLCHLNNAMPFSDIRNSYKYIEDNKKSDDISILTEINNFATKIDNFFDRRVGYTGQLLTDFGNGIHFKRILEEKGFDGYQFNEERSSPTICLFDSSKLTPPIHIIVQDVNPNGVS